MEPINSSRLDPSKVLELIKQVDDHRLGGQKDVVVFLGITGAGKSTLVHFLYGDDSKLRAEAVGQGAGIFRIVDQDNKISHGIISKTFLVDFIIDNDTAYYDCPGFNDTRNANYDMAGSYMVRKVLNGAERVKFIYIVNYSSVRDGTERTDFINLLKHATQSIRNIGSYANSIGLLVSKVENEMIWDGSNPQLVSENKIRSNVIEFLQSVKTTIETNPWLYQENNFGNIAIKILDIFLQRSYEDCINVGLFRRPFKAGTLSTMTDMQEAKQNIRTMIERLEFSPSNIQDFAFSISEASVNNIYLMMGEIDKQVMNLMTDVCKNVKHSLAAQMENLDYFNLNTKVTNLLPTFDDTLRSLKNTTNMEDFMREFLILLEKMKVKLDEKTLKDIRIFCNFTKFIHEITNGRNLNVKFFEWSDQVNDIRNFLHESLTWNGFLRELYLQISVYNVYNSCNDIRSFGDINESRMQSFIDLIKYKIPTLTSLTSFNLNINRELKIKDLKHFLNIISERASEEYSSKMGILTIKAENFCLSRLPALISSNSNLKEIRIYAYNTVYFDTDIHATGKELKLIILAPTWEVLGRKVIVLDGSPGRNLYSRRANEDTAGKSGEPGGAAGSFFGLVNSVVNGHLEIRASGGIGGDGQDGGHGSPGLNATTEGAPTEQSIISEKSHSNSVLFIPVGTETSTVYSKTWSGTEGRDGARGGAGGKGGCKGGIEIYGNYEGHISLLCEDGANGKPGSGGEGGAGGKNVVTVSSTEKKENRVGSKIGQVLTTAAGVLVGGMLAAALRVPIPIPLPLDVPREEAHQSTEEEHQTEGETPYMQTEKGSAPCGKKCDEISYEGLVEPQQAELINSHGEILSEYREFIHDMLDDKYRSVNLRKINECIGNIPKNN